MRDYSNIPVLIWEDETTHARAMAQIHHAEPVVLQMPEDFDPGIDAASCGCRSGDMPEHWVDCPAEEVLEALAGKNGMPGLGRLGALAHEAGLVVDVLMDDRRLVIHD